MNVVIKTLLILAIFSIDLALYFILKDKIVHFADHSSIYTVITLQSFVILEILVNYKLTLFLLESLGLAKKYTHYLFVGFVFFCSVIQLQSSIIGSSKWGHRCGGIIECKPSDFK